MRKSNIIYFNSKTLLFGSVLFFCMSLNAQQACIEHVKQSWEIGVAGGFSNYKGDVATVLKLANVKYSYGTSLKYNIDYFSGVRLNCNFINIGAKDSRVKFPLHNYRNESFSASLMEFSALYDYNFIPFLHPKQLINWSPYLVGGLSVIYVNAENTTNSNSARPNVVMALPFGGGSRIQLNPKWILNFEFLARKLFTDKIDFADKTFIDGGQKGILTNNDWVYTLQLGISYTFIRVICPDPVKDL